MHVDLRRAGEANPEAPRFTQSVRFRFVAAAAFGSLYDWLDFFLWIAVGPRLLASAFDLPDRSAAVTAAVLFIALGYAVRPFGAAWFGALADRTGTARALRSAALLAAVSTLAIGCVPVDASIGGALALLLRVAQGLAAGGEWGVGAVHLCEHALPERRGRVSAWLPALGGIGLVLGLSLSALATELNALEATSWFWRVPFLLAGATALCWLQLRRGARSSARPARESRAVPRSPAYPVAWRDVFALLFGIVLSHGVVVYIGHFFALLYLNRYLGVDILRAGALVACAVLVAMPFTVLFGALSDRIGRKRTVLIGTLMAAIACFPVYEQLSTYANPHLAEAYIRHPVSVVAAPGSCRTPLQRLQRLPATSCDVARDFLSDAGIRFAMVDGEGAVAQIRIGTKLAVAAYEPGGKDAAAQHALFAQAAAGAIFQDARYPVQADPARIDKTMVVLALAVLMILVAMVSGPVPAALVDVFPPRSRCFGVAITYQIGRAWFSALPLTLGFALPMQDGGFFPGLGYPVLACVVGFAITLLFSRNTRGDPNAFEGVVPSTSTPL